MDEKPESIWKKSWTGWRGLLLGWLGLMLATLVIFWVVMLASGAHIASEELKLWAAFTLYATAVIFFVLFIRWLFCRRNFKRSLFGCACFATLIALFYAEEDWRGLHDWNKFKREWEAKGEHFDFASVIPPRVPDDQNFAMASIWVESMKATLGPRNSRQWFGDNFAENGRTNFTDRLALNLTRNNDDWRNEPTNGYWAKQTVTDLKPWQAYYRAPVEANRNSTVTTNEFPIALQPQTPAQDVLLALSKYDPAIEELREASQLPYSRFPLNYDGMPAAILLPHLAALKRCSQVLQLRAIAELQNNESDKALADIKLSLRLADSIRTEPFLISHLVRIAMTEITLQPIYEGLAEHKWSDAQLAGLDAELAKKDFLADYEFAIRGERALCIGDIEFFRHPHNLDPQFKRPRLYFLAPFFSFAQMLSNLSGDGSENSHMGFQMLALGFGPSGWIDQNELRIARFETKWYLPVVDADAKTVSPAKIRDAENALGREIRHRTPENILETLLMPALSAPAKKCAREQISVDLSRTAIALERYRLANGNYPDSLDALATQFNAQVPHDIFGGQPLHYRKAADGNFILYSVGWNETDDGGITGHHNGGSMPDFESGDWVWRYPQK
ncbi:MAG TPA: hypothetical protein VK769_04405 [Verrucomicrobiae bacterium]|nr:hypothetical protein [Verrucomicrobiae bacterium]